MLRHAIFTMLIAPFLVINGQASEPKNQLEIQDLDWLVGKWIGAEEPIEGDIEGFGAKGELASMRVSVTRILGGRFLLAIGDLHKDGREVPVFHQIWGVNIENQKLHQWMFDREGSTFAGDVVRSGSEVLVKYRGTTTPRDGPAKALADQLGIAELKYSGEASYSLRGRDTLILVLRNITVAGKPFPWPGANTEHVHQRAE